MKIKTKTFRIILRSSFADSFIRAYANSFCSGVSIASI